MKKIYLLSAVALLGLASCNDYDDQFDIADQITDVKDGTQIVLQASDYKTIAGLSENIALAAKLDAERGDNAYTEALAKLGDQKYFDNMITAEQFLPAYIHSLYRHADEGSKFRVTYNNWQKTPDYLDDLSTAKEYTLKKDDYATIWDGASNAAYLTPATVSKLPETLKTAYPKAGEGDIAVVNYAYSDFEPAGGATGSTVTYTKISDVNANTDGGEYTVKGIVCATYSKGFLMTDKTGYILVYQASEVNIGDEVTVEGTTTQYAGLMQFPKKETELTVTVTKPGKEPNFKHPTAKALTAADFAAYVEKPYVQYVTYTGKLTINGFYYNVAIEGTNVQGSLAYVPEGMVPESFNGKTITVYGYTVGAPSNKKFVNTMITGVVDAESGAKFHKAPARATASNGTNASAVYRFDGENWKRFSSSNEAAVIAAQPGWYTIASETYFSNPDKVMPTFLSSEYPFAQDGKTVAVIFRGSASALKALEYKYSATQNTWVRTMNYKTQKTTFQQTADGFVAMPNTYLEAAMATDNGGFTEFAVDLGGLTYVWKLDTKYSCMKASAYASNVNHKSESWLVSPAINLTEAENPEMNMAEAMKFLNNNTMTDFIQIKVSTNFDGENVAEATWKDLEIDESQRADGNAASFTFVNIKPVSLSDYKGKSIHIAFVYKSTESCAPTYEFKNVIVGEK